MSGAPAVTWRAVAEVRAARPPRRGLDRAWAEAARRVRGLWGRPAARLQRARGVVGMAREMEGWSSEALRARWAGVEEEAPGGREALMAVVWEVVRRQSGLALHVEQVAGAMALRERCVVEMATGEGKTVTAAAASLLAARDGRGCHVVTVNDYLAQRDAAWMAPVFAALGMRVGVVTGEMGAEARREAYEADVTYVTHKEVAADFLRDRLTWRACAPGCRGLAGLLLTEMATGRAAARPVMRGLSSAIVDEADSVLIDDAVTPLILSARQEGDAAHAGLWHEARRVADGLARGSAYVPSARGREVRLTASGRDAVLQEREGRVLSRVGTDRALELVTQSLVAKHHFRQGHEYIVVDGRVVIVDESTGRLMPDRTWRSGLHQAVEVREGVAVTGAQVTAASISFQRFFNLYEHLAGMTGTAAESAAELWHTYDLPVVVLPTHRPVKRRFRGRVMTDRAATKWARVADAIEAARDRGQPVLAGTRSIEASVALSGALTVRGIEHAVLNGTQDESEAEIVARAGEAGRVTVATNMAGRGTDIRLSEAARSAGGLFVVATEAHESRRVDRQLFGRAGRQGDPGEAVLFAALEDDLYRRFGGRWLGLLPRGVAAWMTPWVQRRAERAGRVERRRIAERDDWLEMSLAMGEG